MPSVSQQATQKCSNVQILVNSWPLGRKDGSQGWQMCVLGFEIKMNKYIQQFNNLIVYILHGVLKKSQTMPGNDEHNS